MDRMNGQHFYARGVMLMPAIGNFGRQEMHVVIYCIVRACLSNWRSSLCKMTKCAPVHKDFTVDGIVALADAGREWPVVDWHGGCDMHIRYTGQPFAPFSLVAQTI